MTTNDRLLGQMNAKLDTLISEVAEIRKQVPAECACHAKAIDNLERGQRDLWDTLKTKAGWTAVAIVLAAFGTIVVTVVKFTL